MKARLIFLKLYYNFLTYFLTDFHLKKKRKLIIMTG